MVLISYCILHRKEDKNERNITDHIHLTHSSDINHSTANIISIWFLGFT